MTERIERERYRDHPVAIRACRAGNGGIPLVLVLLPPRQTLFHSTAPPPHPFPPDMEFFYTENKQRVFPGCPAPGSKQRCEPFVSSGPLFGEGSGNGIPLLSVSAKVFCVRLLKILFVFPFSLFKAEPVQKKNKFLNLCFDLV